MSDFHSKIFQLSPIHRKHIWTVCNVTWCNDSTACLVFPVRNAGLSGSVSAVISKVVVTGSAIDFVQPSHAPRGGACVVVCDAFNRLIVVGWSHGKQLTTWKLLCQRNIISQNKNKIGWINLNNRHPLFQTSEISRNSCKQIYQVLKTSIFGVFAENQ